MKRFGLIFAGIILFRLMVMAFIDPIDDETYHWSWAQYLNFSYFDHPGMVAWVIRPFTDLLGHSPFVLRLPGFFLVLGICFLLHRLGREIFSEQVGQWAAVLLFFVPLWGFAGLGTLPDVPLAFFWLLVFYFFWQTVRPDSHRWSVQQGWLSIGVAMGLGMNSKLTCCLIGVGMGLYLLTDSSSRKQLLTPWPWIATSVTFLLMSPIFVWNQKNSWATFQYQFVRRHTEDYGANWGRWFEFLGQQAALMSPGFYLFLIVTFFVCLFRFRDFRYRLIWCLAAPALLLFYYQPLFAAYKPHWSGPSYLILFLAALALFFEGFWKFRPRSMWIAIPVSFFLILMSFLFLPLFTPIITRVASAKVPSFEPKYDYSNEFYGWVVAAKKAEELQKIWGAQLLGAQRYELVSQLTWAVTRNHELRGEKTVFDVANPVVWSLANESNQFFYDQVSHRDKIWGKSAVIVNNDKYPRDPRDFADFESCEKVDLPVYRRAWSPHVLTEPGPDGVHARTFYIWHCKNLRALR